MMTAATIATMGTSASTGRTLPCSQTSARGDDDPEATLTSMLFTAGQKPYDHAAVDQGRHVRETIRHA